MTGMTVRLRLRRSGLALALVWAVAVPASQQPQTPLSQSPGPIRIVEVARDHLTWRRYEPTDASASIDLSDLEVKADIIGKGDPLGYYFSKPEDIKPFLVENGFATLRDPSAASADLKAAAERRAKATYSLIDSAWQSTKRFFQSVWSVILLLGALGIIGAGIQVAYHVWKDRKRERHVDLLVVGESYVGKTFLVERLRDPRASMDELTKRVGETKGEAKSKLPKPIVHGRYELYVTLYDIGGVFYGALWDHLAFYPPDILILTLAPFAISPPDSGIDKDYVERQLAFTEMMVGGYLRSRLPKPKVVLLFVNKADSFPDSKKETLRSAFKPHVAGLEAKGGVRIVFLVGSAHKGWECREVLDVITDELFAT